MPINVTPIAGLSDDINDIRLRTARIVNENMSVREPTPTVLPLRSAGVLIGESFGTKR